MATRIIPAGVRHVATVASILTEASDWLRQTGKGMWRPDETTPDAIEAHVAEGLYFLGLIDDAPMGTLRFQLSDPGCWPEVTQGDSAFVHRLAVRRTAAGTGLSSAMLSWAADRARSLDRRYLRLDCDPSRTALRSLYERCGFRLHSVIPLSPKTVHALGCSAPAEGSFILARYEMALASP